MKNIPFFIYLLSISFSIIFISCKDETSPVTPSSEHMEPEGWMIRDEALNPKLVVWQGVIQTSWNGSPVSDTLAAPIDSVSGRYSIKLLDDKKMIITQPASSDYVLKIVINDTSTAAIVQDLQAEWAFYLRGKNAGTTSLELLLFHLGHIDVRTPEIPVVVPNPGPLPHRTLKQQFN